MSYNLAYSTDAITWNTGIVYPTLESFSKIAYRFNHFVAFSQQSYNTLNLSAYSNNTSNTYSVSLDGINWTGRFIEGFFSPPNVEINSLVTDNNGFFVIPNGTSTNVPYYLQTGNLNPSSWRNTSNNFPLNEYPRVGIYGVLSNTGYWVTDSTRELIENNTINISPYNRKNQIIKISTNGVNWFYPNQSLTSSFLVKSHKFVSGNNRFLAIFEESPVSADNPNLRENHRIAYSTNGITWQESNPLPISDLFKIKGAVIAANNRYIIAGIEDRNNNFINSGLYSTDGINWSFVSFPSQNINWNVGAFGNNKFVLMARNSNDILTSTDGVNWSLSSPLTQNRNWSDLIYANNRFFAISKDIVYQDIGSSSSSNNLGYITDVISFPELNNCPHRLKYDENNWFKLINSNTQGVYGKYQSSRDRTNWVTRNLPNTNDNKKYHLVDVDYGNSKWIIPTNENNGENILTGYGPLLVSPMSDTTSTVSWQARNILSNGSNTLISGYQWTHIKYGGNKWILAGNKKGIPNDVDGYILFMYNILYKRLPTSVEIQSHKSSLGTFSNFGITEKAKLVMNIMGFASNGTINNFNRDYTSHGNPIVRTFERLRNYGVGTVSKNRYYQILNQARTNNNLAPSADGLWGYMCSDYQICNPSASNAWNLTRGIIESIDDLIFKQVAPQNLQPNCSTCICSEGGEAGNAMCWLRQQMWPLINVFETTEGYYIQDWVNPNFPNHTYGATFTLFHQFASAAVYRRPEHACHNNYTAGCGYNTIRNFEHRIATAFLRLVLLDQWHTSLNNVPTISESEVQSILSQYESIGNSSFYNYLFYSTNDGTDWNLASYFNDGKPCQHIQHAFNKFFISTPRNNDTIDGYVSNDGISWTVGGFPQVLTDNNFPSDFVSNSYNKQLISSDFNPNDGTFIVTSQSNKVFRSANSGNNFTEITNKIQPIQSPRSRLKSVSYLGQQKWGISEEKFSSQDYYIPSRLLISNNNGNDWFTEQIPNNGATELELPIISNKQGSGFMGGCNLGFIINISTTTPVQECSLVTWNQPPFNNTFTQNVECIDLKNPCYFNQIDSIKYCTDQGGDVTNPDTIYISFEKYDGGTDIEGIIDEPHIRVKNAQFYYKTPKNFYKFIEELKGYGLNTHNINGFGTGFIDNPTGYQPAMTFITGIQNGVTDEFGQILIDRITINELNPVLIETVSNDGLNVSFSLLDLPCTGECIENKINKDKIYLDYVLNTIESTGFFSINFNKLIEGDSLSLGEETYTFSSFAQSNSILDRFNFSGINNLITKINSGNQVLVTDINNNTVFLKSKLLGESGNNIILNRETEDPTAIIINNRYLMGGESFRHLSNTWDGIFEMQDTDSYTYYNQGYYNKLFRSTIDNPLLNNTIQDVVWEDSFSGTWSIITGLNEEGGINIRTGFINFNPNLNMFYGSGFIPSGRGEFFNYTGLNINITKNNPYGLSGYIVEYMVSGNNFIFTGYLN
jgi:hypothetical protein